MPPANDNIASAVDLAGSSGSVSGDNTDATLETNEDAALKYLTADWPPWGFGGGKTVWYKHTQVTALGSLRLETSSSGGSPIVDSMIVVIDGDDFTTATWLGADDEGGAGSYSKLELAVAMGTEVWIAVDGYNGWATDDIDYVVGDTFEGTFTLAWTEFTPPPPPPNDDYVDAIALTGLSGAVTASVGTPTAESGDSGIAGMWYSFDPPETGWYVFSISNGQAELWRDTNGTRAGAAYVGFYSGAGNRIALTAGTSYRFHVYTYTPETPVSFSYARATLEANVRMINNPELPTPTVPYMTGMTGGGYINLCGGAAPPLTQFGYAGTQFPGAPCLSPDKSEVVWSHTVSGSPHTQKIVLRGADQAAPSDVTLVTHNIDSTNWSCEPSFSPDGQKIVYVRNKYSTGDHDIRVINRDGTGDTSLYVLTGATCYAAYWSPSGDYIAFHKRIPGSAAELWVMEDDGSNPTLIYTSVYSYELNFAVGAAQFGPGFAWQNGADTLGFFEIDATASDALFKTIDFDGANETTIFTDSSREYIGMCRQSWLSDDSGILTRKRTNGTTPFNATQGRHVIIDAGGGGASEFLGTSYDFTGWGYKHVAKSEDGGHEPGWATTDEGQRIYFPHDLSGTLGLASVLESDFSDYRVEHNMSSPAFTFQGWVGRGVN